MNFLFSLVLAVLGAFFSVETQAHDLITSRAVLADPAGTLQIGDVTQAELSPIGPVLAKGFTSAVHWLRITVQAPAKPGPVVLRIRPTFLDEVRLYEPDLHTPGAWMTRVTGDRYSYDARDSGAIPLGFVVYPQTTTTYYLRLQTTSSSMMNVQALTQREAQLKDQHLDIFKVFYLAFMSAMLFWAISDYATHRQTVTLLFVVQQLVYLFYSMAFMGYLAPFMPTESPPLGDKLTSLLTVCIVGFGALFHRGALALYKPPRWLLHFLAVLIAVSFFNLVAVASGYARVPLSINSKVALVLGPVFMVAALMARQEGAPSLQVMRVIYGVFMLSLAMTVLPLLGLVSITEWSLYALLIHGLMGSSLMFIMLYWRAQQLRKTLQTDHVALKLAQQQLALELDQKEKQGRFMLMLTHELKTPMAVVRMALDAMKVQGPIKKRADQALHDMSQIVERCQQVEQLEQQGFSVALQTCDVGELLHDLIRRSPSPERIELPHGPLPTVTGDPLLLRIVLDNLLSNALKYAAPATPVIVHAEPAHHQGMAGLLVRVQNQPGAAGLPDATRVFDKYYRSPGAQQQTGSGLGLYLVRSIMTLLGGEVTMQSMLASQSDADGRAADALSFSVWIPC
jgi:two-component system, sensor histidine kinase LadS